MAKRQLIVLLLLTVLVSCAHTNPKVGVLHTMGFHNESDKTMVYYLYWITPLYDSVEVAKGELLPGELNTIDITEGQYYIMWVETPSYNVVYEKRFIHFFNTTFEYR